MLATTSIAWLPLGIRLFALVLGCASSTLATSASLGTSTSSNTATSSTEPPGNGLSVAVEYYHPGLDHYFVTADALEIEALTSGKFSGWLATGEKFAVLPPHSSIASSTPVCRFYGDPSKGLNSHFYSGMPEECATVKTQFADSWLLESDDVYRAFLPDNTGSCPAGTEAVYRLWNNRADVNHRYTTSADIAKQMKALGYIAEGFGAALSIPVALCAPVGMACALAAANPMPAVGSLVTLTSTCTGNPTSYVWSGCDSNSEACLATSSIAGVQTYGVVAIGSAGASAPTAIALDWQPAALTASGTRANPSLPGSAVSCSLSASNTAPAVGSSITLSALCTVIPTSFVWTGCASTSSTCTATSSNGGSVTYSVSARTTSGAASPASITVNWQGTGSFAPTAAPTVTPGATPAPTPIAAILPEGGPLEMAPGHGRWSHSY